MADVFEVLGADHAQVKDMLVALEESQNHAPGGVPGETVQSARQEVAKLLIMDSSRHEAAEEQHFWPAVRERLEDGKQLADEAISQESEAKNVLARLDKLSSDDAEFTTLIAEFIPAARAHIAFEETQVWPSLRAALSAAEAEELGEKIRRAEDKGPTRPHPHTPANLAVLKKAGPVVRQHGRTEGGNPWLKPPVAVRGRGRPRPAGRHPAAAVGGGPAAGPAAGRGWLRRGCGPRNYGQRAAGG
jgi:hemerythrin-like domain-containing protein